MPPALGPAQDAHDSSRRERQHEAARGNAHQLSARFIARSTSLRSSTASSDGLSSPSNPLRSYAGASSVHSSLNSGPAHEAYDGLGRSHAGAGSVHSSYNGGAANENLDGLAPAFEAGPVTSSHSFLSNQEYGPGSDVPPRTLSPEAGMPQCMKGALVPMREGLALCYVHLA